ncbi:MAG: crotonase/enoyl-CoA hydratase family protein [Acidobacteriota bacterium]|nr:crotonase/enoyl-CoA hydratase family protein [Acidobacteriota bacterium]
MPQIIVERDAHTMILTLNRPKRLNAFTGTMLVTLVESYAEAMADDDVRCIILTGAGGNFSSGADLKAMAGLADEEDARADAAEKTAADPDIPWKGFLKIDRPLKPIIAAVEGVAIAGGTEILLGTDIRVAGESARFGVSEVRWSLYPMAGSAVRLPRQIPYTAAAEILLTGKHITAAEAKQLGLIGHVVPDGQALDKAKEIAAQISLNGPLAVEAVLQTIRSTGGMTEAEAFADEWPRGQAVFASEDAKEGPKAFSEKRVPDFKRR